VRNLITDVAGLKVGHAGDLGLGSGTTVIVFDEPAVASVDVRGGGPGTRETELLNPAQTVPGIDAIVVSGGSAFGLDAASGVQAWLREQGRGFAIGQARVPIVPGAVLFDLLRGGNKNWGRFPPYREFGYAAAAKAALDFGLGSFGAGTGATTVNYKGGLGSASARTADGITIGALAAVNAVGSRGLPEQVSPQMLEPVIKGVPGANTTLVVVATDAILTKAQAHRLAVMAQTGMSRAIYPVHSPLDGDTLFAAATGRRPLADPVFALTQLGTLAANVVTRAIARGVFAAEALPGDPLPSWKDKFGR
jgi:L-aminopeptidase/D-esterase-like protein